MPRIAGILLCAALAAAPATAAEVRVAVAANFGAPMQRVAAEFERDTGHTASLAFGSTGRFYAQIRNGAPFDVLLAADAETPARLEKEGAAVAGTRFTYATGRLALWSAKPGFVDGRGDVLRAVAFERIAIADPKLAPYGAAAIETLARLGLLESLRPKFVQGESIGQAFQFVASGAAPLGFVALSQVPRSGPGAQGSTWIVPSSLHAPIRQDAVLLAAGRDNPAARALLDFLRGAKARGIVRAFGYEP